jgi:hypothetical protein
MEGERIFWETEDDVLNLLFLIAIRHLKLNHKISKRRGVFSNCITYKVDREIYKDLVENKGNIEQHKYVRFIKSLLKSDKGKIHQLIQSFLDFINENRVVLKTRFLKIEVEKSEYDIFANTSSKPNEDEKRENEDFCKILRNEQKISFALSDGAGGSGLLSAKWSRFLVEKFLEKNPTKKTFDNWIGDFYEEFAISEKRKINDPFKRSKFIKEGSFATLIGGKIELKTDEVSAIAYGDSVLFHFSKDWDLKKQLPEITLQGFLENPKLINWKDNIDEKRIYEYSAEVKIGDKIILASDALSALILLLWKLEKRKNLDIEIPQILESKFDNKLFKTVRKLKDKNISLEQIIPLLKNDFSNTVNKFYEQGYLMKDDYSIAIIERKK